MTPKQKIASQANWNKLQVEGAIANLMHVANMTSDDYQYKLLHRVIKDLKKVSIAIEIERDKNIANVDRVHNPFAA